MDRAAARASAATPTASMERLIFGRKKVVHHFPSYVFACEDSVTNCTHVRVRANGVDEGRIILAYDAACIVKKTMPWSILNRPSLKGTGNDVVRDVPFGYYYIPSDLPDPRLGYFDPAPCSRDLSAAFTSVAQLGTKISVGRVLDHYGDQPMVNPCICDTKSVFGYSCNSEPGDCGSIVYSTDGPIGIHIGWANNIKGGYSSNLFSAFLPHASLLRRELRAPPKQARPSTTRALARFVGQSRKALDVAHSIGKRVAIPNKPKFRLLEQALADRAKAENRLRVRKDGAKKRKDVKTFGAVGESRRAAPEWVFYGESKPFHYAAPIGAGASAASRPSGAVYGGPVLTKPKVTTKKEGLVSMGPATSDYIGPSGDRNQGLVQSFVETMTNPWSGTPTRLPDSVIVPTALAKFFANRTYTFSRTATSGGNFLFGLNTRLNMAGLQNAICAEAPITVSGGSVVNPGPMYQTSPGNILTPLQWGAAGYADPSVGFGNGVTGIWPPGASAWGDDFGAAMASTVPYVAAYRTLGCAMRVRIVGLPPSQFMTPGKIYFAQIRYDREDLPVTEQDFVTLEQLGRATHVSADAVRASGSKTIFATPDGHEKFGMTSNFVLAPGLVPVPSSTAVEPPRLFPDVANALTYGDILSSVIPYRSSAYTAMTGVGVADSSDSANADSTTVLLMAYFGASDGVVLEIDYANVVEYIANKSSPAGVESVVQMPSSVAMDHIFAAAAVASQMRPILIQSPGDKTIANRSVAGGSEASKVRAEIVRLGASRVGRCVESNWIWDLFSKGSLGGGKIKWDL